MAPSRPGGRPTDFRSVLGVVVFVLCSTTTRGQIMYALDGTDPTGGNVPAGAFSVNMPCGSVAGVIAGVELTVQGIMADATQPWRFTASGGRERSLGAAVSVCTVSKGRRRESAARGRCA